MKFSKRSWLNPRSHEDTGHVKSEACLSPWKLEAETVYDISAEFALADCSRKVTLEFGCSTQKAAEQRIRKLDLVISHLEGIKEVINEHKEKLHV